MYAVFASGGKQHRVQVDTLIDIEKLDAPVGEKVTLSEILVIGDGTPYLENTAVVGEVVQQAKNKKIVVFKSKRRKGYKRKLGHRQRFTRLRITEIQDGSNASEEGNENGS
ncbi:50S ribosomal protein L21 [Geodia barretti]|uniref:Large ribosomal subunit protein bL21m n=1 Tax=Geodia barretti TaxID=519541 RepID=A0AA35W7L2_GEOBA|nr:50S ribosomal protein L21 [Geodia barretti]